MIKNYLLKSLLSLVFASSSVLSANAQSLSAPTNITLVNDLAPHNQKQSALKGITVCGTDTVDYPIYKTTGLRLLSLNNATSAFAAGQYYNAADSVIINGFDFFAFKANTTNGTTITISAELYLAGQDSLPAGSALATQTLVIDTTFGGGTLSAFRQTVSFSSPVKVGAPYVLVVSNNSATNIVIVCNNYTATPVPDGRFEDLSSARIGANWLNGSSLNLGGNPFNADFLMYPHVDYDLNTDFTLSPDSLFSAPSAVAVNNNSTPLLFDRMYNFNALANAPSNTYNYGNGGGLIQVVDSSVTFSTLQNYTINLTDTLRQFNGGLCISTETKTLAVGMAIGLKTIGKQGIDFVLYPNPANYSFTLKTDTRNERLFIVGMDGKIVSEQLITSKTTQVETSDLSNGIYFIKVGDTVQKLIINK